MMKAQPEGGPQTDEMAGLLRILGVGIVFTLLMALLMNRGPGADAVPGSPPNSEAAATRAGFGLQDQVMARATGPRLDDSWKPSSQIGQNPLNTAERWGMEAVGLHLTAQGALLHFRYKVVDSLKAGQVGLEGGDAYILDQAGRKTSARTVPSTGGAYAARHLNQVGTQQSTFFANSRGLKSGDLVTVVMGRFRAENVRIQ
jgi:hypothetical protein